MTALLGLCCTALSVSFVWPQVLKIYRRGTVEGVAPGGTLHGLAACTLWTFYGAAQGLVPIVVSNAVIGLAMLLIAAAQVHHHALTVGRLGVVLAAAGVLGGAALATSTTLAGWLAILVGVTAILPQTLHVARVTSLSGISLPMYVLMVLSIVLWAAYAVLVEDWLVLTTNVLIAPCAVFVLLKAWRSQAGVLSALELP